MKYVFILLLFIVSNALNGQNQIIKGEKRNTFEHNTKVYKANELGEIFATNNQANFSYNKWKDSTDDGQGFIVVGATLLVASYFVAASEKNACSNNRRNSRDLIGPLCLDFGSKLMVIGGIVIGSIGLIKLSSEGNQEHLLNAIDIYNGTYSKTPTQNTSNYIVNVGYSGGNVGLFVTF